MSGYGDGHLPGSGGGSEQGDGMGGGDVASYGDGSGSGGDISETTVYFDGVGWGSDGGYHGRSGRGRNDGTGEG